MDTAPLIVIIIVGLALWIAMCYFGFRWIFLLKGNFGTKSKL